MGLLQIASFRNNQSKHIRSMHAAACRLSSCTPGLEPHPCTRTLTCRSRYLPPPVYLGRCSEPLMTRGGVFSRVLSLEYDENQIVNIRHQFRVQQPSRIPGTFAPHDRSPVREFRCSTCTVNIQAQVGHQALFSQTTFRVNNKFELIKIFTCTCADVTIETE